MVSASSGKTVTSLNPSTGEIVRPEYANDENNAFLRSIYEKVWEWRREEWSLISCRQDWPMRYPIGWESILPLTKYSIIIAMSGNLWIKMYISEDSSLFDYSLDKSQEESKVVGKGSVINTSTPGWYIQSFSPSIPIMIIHWWFHLAHIHSSCLSFSGDTMNFSGRSTVQYSLLFHLNHRESEW